MVLFTLVFVTARSISSLEKVSRLESSVCWGLDLRAFTARFVMISSGDGD